MPMNFPLREESTLTDSDLRQNDWEKKVAFTLAEVLITIGIIGVVAAMTIPSLLINLQDKQFKAMYKKYYSTLAQALL